MDWEKTVGYYSNIGKSVKLEYQLSEVNLVLEWCPHTRSCENDSSVSEANIDSQSTYSIDLCEKYRSIIQADEGVNYQKCFKPTCNKKKFSSLIYKSPHTMTDLSVAKNTVKPKISKDTEIKIPEPKSICQVKSKQPKKPPRGCDDVNKNKSISFLKSKRAKPIFIDEACITKGKIEPHSIRTVSEVSLPRFEKSLMDLRDTAPSVEEKDRDNVNLKQTIITISRCDDDDSTQWDEDFNPILMIDNQTEIRKDKSICSNEKTDSFQWTFKFQATTNETADKTIMLENKGTVAITYWWIKYISEALLPLQKLIRNSKSPFHFNKNKSLILPGQYVEFKVYYRSDRPGVDSEVWLLKTTPILKAADLQFNFTGMCSEASDKISNKHKINCYLDRRVRDSTVNGIILELMDKIKESVPQPPSYPSLFLQSEIRDHLASLPLSYFKMTKELAGNESNPQIVEIMSSVRQEKKANLLRRQEMRDKANSKHKYSTVYTIVAAFFNEFEKQSQHVQEMCCLEYCSDRVIYSQIFYNTMYEQLCFTFEKLFAAIDSSNRLHNRDA